jgi:protein-S-isoprenylcysteine O-methyltransferase Ste14
VRSSPRRAATALFLAAVLTFALVDLALIAGARLSLPMSRVAPLLAYALLGAFALAFAVMASIALGAWRARSAPDLGDVIRGSVVLLLVLLHALLLFVARRR